MRRYFEAVWRTWLTVGSGNEAARAVWVERALKLIPSGTRLLDAGAGEGIFRKFCSHLRYVSQDFGKYDGQGNGMGQQPGTWETSHCDIICDITAIPEPDASFGAILCTEVFEHLPEPLKALAEFSRLLEPGGRLILTAPFCSLTHMSPYHFYTGFNRYFYDYHLPRNRFSIIEITPNGNYFSYVAQELRRLPSKADAYAKRPLTLLEKIFAALVLISIQRIEKRDSTSAEFGCFGYHVMAEKIR